MQSPSPDLRAHAWYAVMLYVLRISAAAVLKALLLALRPLLSVVRVVASAGVLMCIGYWWISAPNFPLLEIAGVTAALWFIVWAYEALCAWVLAPSSRQNN